MVRPHICWVVITVFAGLFLIAPYAYYRHQYNHAKRLRVVCPEVLYRGGQMTADGIREAVERFGLRTIVNLQDEAEDPTVAPGLGEAELCKQLGVRYVYLPPELIDRKLVPAKRPATVDEFLKIMDDPTNHPVLIHCRAGLHRTGILAALYRMEYEGWPLDWALKELQENGFSTSQCTARNDYINQYLVIYQPRRQRPPGGFQIVSVPRSSSGDRR